MNGVTNPERVALCLIVVFPKLGFRGREGGILLSVMNAMLALNAVFSFFCFYVSSLFRLSRGRFENKLRKIENNIGTQLRTIY